MYGLAQIYTGCKCGETWRVSPVESIDTANDRVETYLVCDVCGGYNLREKMVNGLPDMHAITEEEHLELSGFYSPIDDWEEEDDPEESYCSEEDLDEICGFSTSTPPPEVSGDEDELPF